MPGLSWSTLFYAHLKLASLANGCYAAEKIHCTIIPLLGEVFNLILTPSTVRGVFARLLFLSYIEICALKVNV